MKLPLMRGLRKESNHIGCIIRSQRLVDFCGSLCKSLPCSLSSFYKPESAYTANNRTPCGLSTQVNPSWLFGGPWLLTLLAGRVSPWLLLTSCPWDTRIESCSNCCSLSSHMWPIQWLIELLVHYLHHLFSQILYLIINFGWTMVNIHKANLQVKMESKAYLTIW